MDETKQHAKKLIEREIISIELEHNPPHPCFTITEDHATIRLRHWIKGNIVNYIGFEFNRKSDGTLINKRGLAKDERTQNVGWDKIENFDYERVYSYHFDVSQFVEDNKDNIL